MAESLAEEVLGAELGDLRLTKRLQKIVERLGNRPNMSIPAATDGRAEMEAAYRFFDNLEQVLGTRQNSFGAYRCGKNEA